MHLLGQPLRLLFVTIRSVLDFVSLQASIQEKLTAAQQSLQAMTSDHTASQEALHKQLTEVKGHLQTTQDKCKKLQSQLAEKGEKLNTLQQKLQQTEGELKTKVNFYLRDQDISTS